jgi:hypothetical protein
VPYPGIERRRAIGTETEPLERTGPEILDHHVGRAEEVLHQRPAVFRLQVDGHTLLVAVDGQVIRAPAVDEGGPGARVVAVARVLDLDHLRAHVPEQHRAQRTSEHAGEVDDLETAQRQIG